MSVRVVHGGATSEERARAAADGITLIDQSASLNPYGPHPAVVAAARGAVLDRYPEIDARTVCAAYAESANVGRDQVLAGNGTSELMYLVARAFGDGGTCLVVGPTFGEYTAAARAAGMSVLETPWLMPAAESHPLSALVDVVERERPTLTFICNPNNPTGSLINSWEITGLADAASSCGGRLIVDEAYMDFAWPESEAVPPDDGRLVLRSLTKLHTVPGLRAGFLLGIPEDIALVRSVQPPWSLSAPAGAAVLEALRQRDFVCDSQRRVAATRDALLTALGAAGFAFEPTRANFVLVDVGDAPAFRRRLLGQGFVVRDCSSFGLPGHVRIAMPRDDQLDALVAAIEAVR